jgi:hypothetical protein
MKDLFVLTADSDAQALIRSVLRRHKDLRIHPISFEVQRFPGRDAGMVKEGPEIARALVKKTEYSRLLLIWDHHGSGWNILKADDAVARIQQRLDGATWAARSAAVVIVPELEEWLWHSPESVARCIGSSAAEFDRLTGRAVTDLNLPLDRCCREKPKEFFEQVFYYKQKRKPLPEHFDMLGSSANLTDWSVSQTFGRLVEILRAWFPAS